jgi:hypothetical protein
MPRKEKFDRKKAAEKVEKVMKTFGETVSEIFEDAELRQKAKEFSRSLVDATAKVIESRIEDDEVKAKFEKVGKAAKNLGESLSEHFKAAD